MELQFFYVKSEVIKISKIDDKNFNFCRRKITRGKFNEKKMINLAKMLIFKSGLILIILLMLLGPSTQISVSSETRQHMHSGIQSNETNSNLDSEPHSHPHPHPITNQVGCLKTIGQCFRHSPKELANCAFEHALNNMDCLIVSNTTWHLNEYISFKKNADWTQNEVEARQQRSLFETVLNKISDLIASRSVQFSLPSEEERKKAGLTLPSISGLSDFGGSGKKKSDFKFFIIIFVFLSFFLFCFVSFRFVLFRFVSGAEFFCCRFSRYK